MQTISITSNPKKNTALHITDRVKTFEDACEVLNIDGEIFVAKLHDFLSGDIASIVAHEKLKIIIRALNEDWTPDWENSNEYKYYPYFTMKGGFRLYDVGCRAAYSGVSSRLCFKSEALAQYAVKQFLPLYKDYYTI